LGIRYAYAFLYKLFLTEKMVEASDYPAVLNGYRLQGLRYMTHGYDTEHPTLIWEAERDGKKAAIKRTANGRKAWAKEAHLMERVSNDPNIACFQEAFVYKDEFFLAMDYVGGTDLPRKLSEETTLTKYMGFMHGIAHAIRYCHQNDVVHMDLKYNNVRVDTDKATVIDFGIAENTGNIVSTLSFGDYIYCFWPPEKRKLFITATPSIDLYSLAALIDFAAAKAYNGSFTEEFLMMDAKIKELGNPLYGYLEASLSKNPKERPKTAAEHIGYIEDMIACPGIKLLEEALLEDRQIKTFL
jgi:serine/threonine protein kinase